LFSYELFTLIIDEKPRMVNNIADMNKDIFSVFKAYDIRGESPQPIDAVFASKLGIALVKSYSLKRVMVGRDMRVTSLELEDALIKSLTSQGVDVVRIGLCSTPMFNVLMGLDGKYDLGIMITASHSPSKYNGFKIVDQNLLQLGLESGLDKIRDAWPDDGQSANPFIAQEGNVTHDDGALDRYVDYVIKLADLPSDMPEMKVAIDAGNGMAGFVMPKLLEKCPWIKAEKMFFELDGSFPNHEANPMKPETLEKLRQTVKQEPFVCGVALDGDADRVGFVDETGVQIKGDILTALFAGLVLKEKRGGKVLFDIRSSWSVAEAIEGEGGEPIIFSVGSAKIKKAMREMKAVYGGECSMHFYFSDLWCVESGDYAMLLMLKHLAKGRELLSAMRQRIDCYHHSDETNFEVKDTKSVLNKVTAAYIKTATKVLDFDGIRCEFGDPKIDSQAWWFNLRASNTEPLVRLTVEATSEELMKEKLDEITKLIN